MNQSNKTSNQGLSKNINDKLRIVNLHIRQCNNDILSGTIDVQNELYYVFLNQQTEIIAGQLYLSGMTDYFNDTFAQDFSSFDVIIKATQQTYSENHRVKPGTQIIAREIGDSIEEWNNVFNEDSFSQIYEVIDSSILNGKKILVHCTNGQSRSVAIVIAYLMRKFGTSFVQTYNYICNLRPIIKCLFSDKLKDFK